MMGDSRKRRRKRRALAEETQRSKGGPEVVADDAKIDDDGKRERERERTISPFVPPSRSLFRNSANPQVLDKYRAP
jgi:hypothetical protein